MANLTDRADYWAEQFGVPKDMYRRLITQESNWSPTAKSHAGAYGLSQAMPDTARQPGYRVKPLTDLENPDEQLRFGAEYFGAMMREYGDPTDALMAYNWGVGNFNDWVKAGRDPNAVPEETRNYVNVINPDRIKATYLKDGTMTNDSLRGMVEGAIDDAERQEMLARQNGGVMPSGVVDPAQSVEANAQNQGLLAKLMPNLSDADRRQNLLAIGAGLLSGEDWQSGAALAGQNLFGVGAERQQRDALLAAKANQTPEYQRIGTVTMPGTGEKIGGASYDPSNAMYFTINEKGERVNLPGAHPTNNSDAIGSRYATQAAKTAEQVKELRGTLSSIDKILPNLDDVKYGAPGLLTDLKGFVKTMSGRMKLSEEEILRRVVSGQTQGLIGKVREDVVGPGVMTENDALRVLAALGGDATAIINGNPEVARRMLSEIHERTYKRYKEAHAQYDAFRDFPGIPFVDIERYAVPDNIDYSGPKASAPEAGEVDGILSIYGL